MNKVSLICGILLCFVSFWLPLLFGYILSMVGSIIIGYTIGSRQKKMPAAGRLLNKN